MSEEWRGTYTALVTPFDDAGSVDIKALERLVDFQIDGEIDGLVVLGTTGESATIESAEKLSILQTVNNATRGRIPVMAGAGGNDTRAVVEFARDAEASGVDALLSVVPYYNRPSQEGLYAHFETIAKAVRIPVFLYNVPSRTGTSFSAETVRRLSELPNVRGIKDASGNLALVSDLLRDRRDGFRVLSGDDELTLPIVSLGGDGVISVVSNEVPKSMGRMVRAALAGRFDESRALHFEMLSLMRANFVDSNPVPVKAAMAMMGLIEENYRLPLVPTGPAQRESIREVLAAMHLLAGSKSNAQ